MGLRVGDGGLVPDHSRCPVVLLTFDAHEDPHRAVDAQVFKLCVLETLVQELAVDLLHER